MTFITFLPSEPVVFCPRHFSMLMLALLPVLAVAGLPEPGTLTDSCVVLAQLQPRRLLMQLISHDALRPSRGLLRLCSSSICMSMLMSQKKNPAHRWASSKNPTQQRNLISIISNPHERGPNIIMMARALTCAHRNYSQYANILRLGLGRRGSNYNHCWNVRRPWWNTVTARVVVLELRCCRTIVPPRACVFNTEYR